MKATRIEFPSGSPRRPPYWTRVVFLTLYISVNINEAVFTVLEEGNA